MSPNASWNNTYAPDQNGYLVQDTLVYIPDPLLGPQVFTLGNPLGSSGSPAGTCGPHLWRGELFAVRYRTDPGLNLVMTGRGTLHGGSVDALVSQPWRSWLAYDIATGGPGSGINYYSIGTWVCATGQPGQSGFMVAFLNDLNTTQALLWSSSADPAGTHSPVFIFPYLYGLNGDFAMGNVPDFASGWNYLFGSNVGVNDDFLYLPWRIDSTAPDGSGLNTKCGMKTLLFDKGSTYGMAASNAPIGPYVSLFGAVWLDTNAQSKLKNINVMDDSYRVVNRLATKYWQVRFQKIGTTSSATGWSDPAIDTTGNYWMYCLGEQRFYSSFRLHVDFNWPWPVVPPLPAFTLPCDGVCTPVPVRNPGRIYV